MNIQISGGEAVARMFQAHGAGPMFGMGGFQLLPFYDAARRLGLRHYLINDERAGIFAADAYAKVSGRVGLVDGTLGPGATNLITGLVEAKNSGTPIVALVGNSHRDHSWKNMTQECRQTEILAPAVKELIRVESIARIPELTRRAFAVATSGRPGPVVLDLPEDVCHAEHSFDEAEFHGSDIHQAIPALRCRPDDASVQRAAEMLAKANRPVILAGGGVHLSGAADTLTRFAADHNVPVAHTMTGKGAVPCTAPVSLGLFGRYDRIANKLIGEADLIIVVGCKLGEIATKRYALPLSHAPMIHIDSDPVEFDRTTVPTLRLWGDARETVSALGQALASSRSTLRSRFAPWVEKGNQVMGQWREEVAPRLNSTESPIAMTRLMHEINRALPEDGYLIADGGFAAHWGALIFDSKRPGRTFVPDRGFASIGYGLPGAIGVALAAPGKKIVSVTGDGGFNMMLGELETARRLKLDFTIVVVNNAASGYVKALQHLMYGEGAYQSSDLDETNYARAAEALGCKGIRVDDPSKLEDAFAIAFRTKGPTILDVVVIRDPAKMLPAVDNRTVKIRKGDRVA